MSQSSRKSSRGTRDQQAARQGQPRQSQSRRQPASGVPLVTESVSEPTPRSARNATVAPPSAESAQPAPQQGQASRSQATATPGARRSMEIPDFLLHPASKVVAEERDAEREAAEEAARQAALDSLTAEVPQEPQDAEEADEPSAHEVVERIAREEASRQAVSATPEEPTPTPAPGQPVAQSKPVAPAPSVADDLDEPAGIQAPSNVPDAVLDADLASLRNLERHRYAHRYAEVGMGCYGPTIDPPHAMADRAEALAILQEEDHDQLCSARMGATLDRLAQCTDRLDATTNAQVRILRRDRAKQVNVSPEDQAAFSRLTTEADGVWRQAKLDNDWASFAPYLDRIVDLMRRIAHERDPHKDPYDVWLDEYEQGTDREFYDNFFSVVKDTVVPLLMDVGTRRQPSRSCIEGHFDEGRQWLLARDIAVLEGIDLDSWWLTATEHPFSDALSNNYAITAAHVHGDDVISNVFTMLHEGGHNLYELGNNPAYNRTSLRGGTSAGMHEGQSRFFENYVGRSEAFAGPLLRTMQTYFRGQLGRVTPHQFYLAINRAEPQPLRMDADELTYPLHIVVRYEIEQLLFSGEATADDVPGLWRDRYKSYLGVRVPDDTRGALQDSHWADGLFGYFPTYALGGAYGAQLRDEMISEGMDWEGLLSAGDLAPIREWLRAHVWQWGRAKDPQDIIREACHTPFDPTHYTNYLTRKFSAIYGL